MPQHEPCIRDRWLTECLPGCFCQASGARSLIRREPRRCARPCRRSDVGPQYSVCMSAHMSLLCVTQCWRSPSVANDPLRCAWLIDNRLEPLELGKQARRTTCTSNPAGVRAPRASGSPGTTARNTASALLSARTTGERSWPVQGRTGCLLLLASQPLPSTCGSQPVLTGPLLPAIRASQATPMGAASQRRWVARCPACQPGQVPHV